MKDIQVPIESKRLKLIRTELGFTQTIMSEKLGTTRSIADMERGRIRIPGFIIMGLFEHYKVNPSWLYGLSNEKYITTKAPEISPKTVAINSDGEENILLVSSKAYAGYTDNLHNVEWFKELPAFNIPLPQFKNSSYRSFQISGDSMTGIVEDGEWALTQALSQISDIINNRIYIVVTNEGILCKKVHLHKKENQFSLVSHNPAYDVILLAAEDINEIWEVKGKICPDIQRYNNQANSQNILSEISNMKFQIETLKNRI